MAPFRSKEAFLVDGVKPHTLSEAEADDCSICKEPLIVNSTETPTQAPKINPSVLRIKDCGHVWDKEFLESWLKDTNTCPMCPRVVAITKPVMETSNIHTAIQIKGCGHVFGKGCLESWLEDANTCPMCRSTLFGTEADAATVAVLDAMRDGVDTIRATDAIYVAGTMNDAPYSASEIERSITRLQMGLSRIVDGLRPLSVEEALARGVMVEVLIDDPGEDATGTDGL
ncbi:hypothetical protein BU26DRAFT_595796 [Trematosphaeria pertusa]|uniref:RING-type domain-containing protein n=1 Tax=Trematosphaeria pertusa TaxID=390896 RepID=A0A6A6ICL5_9PLEO|nr:uncharacterized protein BU26DRAFT_595796 [Trematosphaeria pertusa]KAF2247979.1 hypothetical protein BU26DRAFT_595796 [Trematosphaeria pertusa]